MNTSIDLKSHPFIKDHRLTQHIIIPATWYLESLLAQSLKISNELPITLINLHYHKAIHMGADKNYPISIKSTDQQLDLFIKINQEWELCASGCIQSTPNIAPPPFNIKETLTRCLTHYEKNAYYQSLRHRNYDFGPLHQGIEEVYVGAEEALGKIRFLSDLDQTRYVIHPAFLDACFHVGLSLLPDQNDTEVYVTTAQKQVTLLHSFPEHVWCYAKKIHVSQNTSMLDLNIYNDNNQLLAQITGYQLQCIPLSALMPKNQSSPYYQINWEKKTLAIQEKTSLSLQKIILNPLMQLPEIDNPESTALILLLKTDATIDKNNQNSLNWLLNISKALYQQQIIKLHRLIVVLNQETPLPTSQENIHLKNACIPGFCRTIRKEFPSWNVVCLDAGACTPEDTLALVNQELSLPYEDDEIAYELGDRYVLRLTPMDLTQSTDTSPQKSCIQDNASYLITGGSGGIGLALMRYLLEQGAARIYLLSRHAPKIPPLDERIITLTGNVAKETDIIRVLNEISHSPFPLKGIFHAAGISDDNIIPNLSEEQIERVLQAKLSGSWYLHLHTQTLNLDYFVLFSSITALLGIPGLANYAAANGFLDQLASYRHFMGLPALSIQWGPWETGMLQKKDDEVRQNWLHQGFSIMSSEIALHHLKQALTSKKHQLAIMDINWNTYFSHSAYDHIPSLLTTLSDHNQSEIRSKPVNSEFLASLRDLDETEMTQKLIHYLKKEVERLTGYKVTNLNLSFTELGIKSVTAIEMTQHIGTILGINLPQTLLFNYTRIPILADYLLIDKLHFKAKMPKSTEEKKSQELAQDILQLSDDEVMNLLNDTLKDIDNLS